MMALTQLSLYLVLFARVCYPWTVKHHHACIYWSSSYFDAFLCVIFSRLRRTHGKQVHNQQGLSFRNVWWTTKVMEIKVLLRLKILATKLTVTEHENAQHPSDKDVSAYSTGNRQNAWNCMKTMWNFYSMLVKFCIWVILRNGGPEGVCWYKC